MATLTPISRKPMSLVLPIVGLVGLLVGLLVGPQTRPGGGRVNRSDLFSSAEPCGADPNTGNNPHGNHNSVFWCRLGDCQFRASLAGGLIGAFTDGLFSGSMKAGTGQNYFLI